MPPYEAMEVEAELVAWHICDRWGIVTGSPPYLRPYMDRAQAEISFVDLDRVIRAIAKVEQFMPRRPSAAVWILRYSRLLRTDQRRRPNVRRVYPNETPP
ncbi:hypothetical protein GCM10009076_01860 [Erythrobacter ramosus]